MPSATRMIVNGRIVRAGPLLVCCMLAAAAVNTATAQPALPESGDGVRTVEPEVQRVERGGIAIEFALRPLQQQLVAGGDAIATIRLSDARTGLPLWGARPHAWLSRSSIVAEPKGASRPEDDPCLMKARALASGSLAARADVDLNSYRVLVLGDDRTLSVINPQVSFGITKLESLVVLPANGVDALMSEDADRLWISMPDIDAVGVIDVPTRKLVATLPTGKGSRPGRLRRDPAGRVWVGLEGAPRVAVFDGPGPARFIDTGRGRHDFAFSDDGRRAFVASKEDATVTIIELPSLASTQRVTLKAPPSAISLAPITKKLYVAAGDAGYVRVIDPANPEEASRIEIGRGASAIAFEPEGRYALVLRQTEGRLVVIDSSTHTVVGDVPVTALPDELSFTRRFAYVHASGSERFSLIDLGEIRAGKIEPVEIQAGRQPDADSPASSGPGAMIVAAPEGNAVLIARPQERTLYYYQEGMMAPMGTLSTYGRAPRAILVLDQSLKEARRGEYSAQVHLSSAGSYDIPVVVDEPRMVHCFSAQVAADPTQVSGPDASSLNIEWLDADARIQALHPASLGFRIRDAGNGEPVTGLRDVHALLVEAPGAWQRRRPVTPADDGTYRIEQIFPHAGTYTVMVSVASRGLRWSDARPKTVHVGLRQEAPHRGPDSVAQGRR